MKSVGVPVAKIVKKLVGNKLAKHLHFQTGSSSIKVM